MDYSFTKFIEKLSLKHYLLPALTTLALAGTVTESSAQYCIPTYDFGCGSTDDINSFTLTGQGTSTISDLNTGCGPNNGYEDRTSVFPAIDLMQGGTYTGTVSTNFSSNEYVQVWIDFDSNTVFSPSEAVTAITGPFGSGSPANISVAIPINAPTGLKRMRVRLIYNQPNNFDPCLLFNFGETHDYMANILPAPPCAGTPAITSINPAGPISSCAGATQTLTVSIPIASGYTFQWQQSVNGGVSWSNVGTNDPFYTFTVTGNALYRVYITCANSSLTDTSASVAVNAAPPTYAPLPYFQDFESWTNYCDNSDIPAGAGTNWTNSPSTGDSSWRREDQGNTANWTSSFGAYFPASVSGAHSARFPSANTGGAIGTLDLYLDASQQSGDKGLYFYHINDNSFTQGDSLTLWLSTNGGSSFSQIGSFDSAFFWKKHYVPLSTNSAQTILRFQAKVYNFDWTDIGLDSVYIAAPCSGTPVAGNLSPAGPINNCPGYSYNLQVIGATMGGGITYQWQQSIDNGSTWNNVGSNSINYTTALVYDTTQYRLVVTCAGSGLSDTTDPVILNIAPPVYATLPYVQDFEAWTNACDVSDVPSNNWLNTPATGDLSWRRDDEGASANWFLPNDGAYTPPSFTGGHSARFHSWMANWGSWGDLDLFVDCSVPGTKELQFHQINPTGADEIQIWLSTDGGAIFNQLQSWTTATGWTFRSVPIVSNSAQTVIRFRAVSDFSDDLGIDNVKVLMPCAGAPDAGTVDSLVACSGQDFTLTTTGTTIAGGITNQWQESPDGINWTDIPGATNSQYTTSITTPTWYRLIVNCTNSSLSDTTAGMYITLGSFYFCYCNSTAQSGAGSDIGNFTVKKIPGGAIVASYGTASPLTNNPDANKIYTDNTLLPAVDFYKDSVYRFDVTQINSAGYVPSVVAIYLDLDTNGVFDPINEKIFQKVTNSLNQMAVDSFHIPANAPVGYTGLRVVMVQGASAFPDPCLSYTNGETEDYLAYINYPPCDGSTNPGVARISDTLLCPGFPFTLTDTTHEKFRSGLTWIWEESTDGVNWSEIAGTDSMDVINLTSGTQNTWYRLKMNCAATGLPSYTLPVTLTIKAPYECYCESFANGGSSDLSDIGAFSIGSYIFNSGGPHLNNPVAVKPYTGHPAPVMTLYADSSYPVALYHIIKDNNHQDAKVTLFIDYNNNFVYDVPSERVWTGFTDATNVFINSNLDIPNTAVMGIPTGMRLIINNDTGPNVPSDEACGPYTSGETEDFAVKIMPKGSMGIGHANSGFSFDMYPNPATGLVKVKVSGLRANKEIVLGVYTITGQQVYQKKLPNSGSETEAEMDLGTMPRGVYFVELKLGAEKQVKKLILR